MAAVTEDPRETKNAPIGGGIVETHAAYVFAVKHNLGQIVDLDNSAGDFVEDLAKSAAYLRGLGK